MANQSKKNLGDLEIEMADKLREKIKKTPKK
jgi:hypothetical protein